VLLIGKNRCCCPAQEIKKDDATARVRVKAIELPNVIYRKFPHQGCVVALAEAEPDDVVYLDPPYHRIGGYSDFNRYTSGKFKEIDHLRLRNVCVDLDRRGIRWVQSNSSTKYIREVYRDFRLSEITNRREINLDSQSRNITELVIKNF